MAQGNVIDLGTAVAHANQPSIGPTATGWGKHPIVPRTALMVNYAVRHKHSHHNEMPVGVALSVPAADSNQTVSDFVPSPDEVARKAYFTYVNEGSPLGRDVEHWLNAETQLIAERNLTRVHGFRSERHR
jgi:hypothetical protein